MAADDAHVPGEGSAETPDRADVDRVARLLEALEGPGDVFVLTHDNPDPDALASAAALAFLAGRLGDRRVRVAFGGIVGRAENRALIQEMALEFERVEDLEIAGSATIALVDTQPRAGNNSVPAGRIVHAVIDHHPPRSETAAATYTDIRTEYGATGSILVEYMRAAGVEPDPWLATALFYAIQSETMDLGRETSRADVDASLFLYPRSDPAAISRIRHARVPASYFRTLHQALGVARRHDRVIVAPLGALPYPDMVAEIADLFLQMNGVSWTIASGRHRDRLLFSIRTYDESAHAGTIVRAAIGDRGSAGGHGTFAGGQIDVRGQTEEEAGRIQSDVVRELVESLGADPSESVPLVPDDSVDE